jgi:hypothetical protein
MKELENPDYLLPYLFFNGLALIILFFSWKSSRIARLLLIGLFAWASWMNWTTAINDPKDYLNYSTHTFSTSYRDFINGWFSNHILLVVGTIATSQALIAFGISMKGFLFRLACVGGIIFLLAIIPLGIGSGFPCTLVIALAMVALIRENDFIWKNKDPLLKEQDMGKKTIKEPVNN